MRTMTSKFSVKSEEMIRKLTNRMTTPTGAVALNVEKIYPPKRGIFGKVSDWFAGIKRSELPEVLYSISASSVIYIDGRYDPDAIAEGIMRIIPPDTVVSFTEVDDELGETRTIEIHRGRRRASSDAIA